MSNCLNMCQSIIKSVGSQNASHFKSNLWLKYKKHYFKVKINVVDILFTVDYLLVETWVQIQVHYVLLNLSSYSNKNVCKLLVEDSSSNKPKADP